MIKRPETRTLQMQFRLSRLIHPKYFSTYPTKNKLFAFENQLMLSAVYYENEFSDYLLEMRLAKLLLTVMGHA